MNHLALVVGSGQPAARSKRGKGEGVAFPRRIAACGERVRLDERAAIVRSIVEPSLDIAELRFVLKPCHCLSSDQYKNGQAEGWLNVVYVLGSAGQTVSKIRDRSSRRPSASRANL